MAIDIGSPAIDRPVGITTGTFIDLNNPAEFNFTIHEVQVWFKTNATGVRVGTFYRVSYNQTFGWLYKCRASTPEGVAISGGSLQTIAAAITALIGDYIGCYFVDGTLAMTQSDAGADDVRIITGGGECIDPGDQGYTGGWATSRISVYGTESPIPPLTGAGVAQII